MIETNIIIQSYIGCFEISQHTDMNFVILSQFNSFTLNSTNFSISYNLRKSSYDTYPLLSKSSSSTNVLETTYLIIYLPPNDYIND